MELNQFTNQYNKERSTKLPNKRLQEKSSIYGKND